jgi:hypothetical protein
VTLVAYEIREAVADGSLGYYDQGRLRYASRYHIGQIGVLAFGQFLANHPPIGPMKIQLPEGTAESDILLIKSVGDSEIVIKSMHFFLTYRHGNR